MWTLSPAWLSSGLSGPENFTSRSKIWLASSTFSIGPRKDWAIVLLFLKVVLNLNSS